MQWRLQVDIDRLYRVCETHDYATIADAICRLRAERLGKRSWGDKTPQYVFDLGVLSTLFPRSKFINLVRDGRDVALSLLGQPWGPANVYSCAVYWKHCTEVTPIVKALERDGRLLEVKYESLLAQPKLSIEEILRFLGEPLSAVLDDDVQTIRKQNSGRWRTRMGAADVRLFEEVAGDRLRALGYPTSYESRTVSPWRRIAYRGSDFLRWGVFMAHQNLIQGFRIRYLGKEPFAE